MQTFQELNSQELITEEKSKIDKDTMNILYNFSKNELKNDIGAFGDKYAKKVISEVVNFVKSK